MIVARRKTAATQVARLRGSLRDIEHQYVILKRGPQEGWHQINAPGEPRFQAGWSNAQTSTDGVDLGDTPPAGFFKDNDSLVWLRGVLQRNQSATGTVAFFLPPAYRPPYNVMFAAGSSQENFAAMQIRASDGAVLERGAQALRAQLKNPNQVFVSGNGSGGDVSADFKSGYLAGIIGIPTRRVFSTSYIRFRAAS